MRTLPLMLALALLAGCAPEATTPAAKPTPAPEKAATTPEAKAAPAPEVKAAPPTARATADGFLKLLGDAKPDLGVVAPDFLATLGPPVFDAEKQKGYSPGTAEERLKKLGGGVEYQIVSDVGQPDGASAWYRGVVQKSQKAEQFALWVAKSADGLFRVRWLHRSPVTGAFPDKFALPLEQMQPVFVAQAFLEVVAGRTALDLAPLLMTPGALKAIGGEPTAGDKAAGRAYNAAFLKTKLGTHADATAYALKKIAVEAKTAAVEGELVSPSGKQPFTLTLVPDAAGTTWQIDAFTLN